MSPHRRPCPAAVPAPGMPEGASFSSPHFSEPSTQNRGSAYETGAEEQNRKGLRDGRVSTNVASGDESGLVGIIVHVQARWVSTVLGEIGHFKEDRVRSGQKISRRNKDVERKEIVACACRLRQGTPGRGLKAVAVHIETLSIIVR